MRFADHSAGQALAAAFSLSSRNQMLSPEADTALRKKIGFRIRRSVPDMITPENSEVTGSLLCGQILAMAPTLSPFECVRAETIARAFQKSFATWAKVDAHIAAPLLRSHIMQMFATPMLQCFDTDGVLDIMRDR